MGLPSRRSNGRPTSAVAGLQHPAQLEGRYLGTPGMADRGDAERSGGRAAPCAAPLSPPLLRGRFPAHQQLAHANRHVLERDGQEGMPRPVVARAVHAASAARPGRARPFSRRQLAEARVGRQRPRDDHHWRARQVRRAVGVRCEYDHQEYPVAGACQHWLLANGLTDHPFAPCAGHGLDHLGQRYRPRRGVADSLFASGSRRPLPAVVGLLLAAVAGQAGSLRLDEGGLQPQRLHTRLQRRRGRCD